MGTFVTDSRRISMSRIDDRVVRQGQELCTDAVEEGWEVAAGEVGAADAFEEKDVAADEEALPGAVESHATGGMSRKEEDGQVIVPDGNGTTGSEQEVFSPIIFEWHPPVGAHFRRQGQDGFLLFVEMGG